MNDPAVDLAQAIRNLADNMPALLQHAELGARVRRHYFLALLNQGFTEAQAMELVGKVNGVMM